jgi:hypothetical protein
VSDVVNASLFGTVTNTITVGQRLNVSPAVETKNAAAAGKTRFVVDSLPLLAAKGIALDGIEIPGARLEGTKATAIGADKALAQLAKFRDLDAGDPSEPAEVNEAGYFKRGLQAIDSMVRFLRGVELRADDYRRLQRDAIAARDRVTAALHGLRADAAALEGQLAEVRHDLQVARALRAEEMARVAARIARRLAILQENVPYLVFRRPRTTQALDDVPLREAQPALVENLVPHLRAAVGDLPPELQQMVNTLKDVPARWFKTLPALVDKFDRIDNLRLLLDRARERVAVTATPPIQLVEAAATPTAQRLQVGLARHVERVQFSLQKSALQLANVNAGSWKEAAAQLKEAVSISDLLVTARPNRAVTLAAAGLLDDIAGVAGGLYEAFCRVPPALRLRWAESFSQLDADASLRQLSVLPGFGQEPGIGRPGLDYIEWKQMQGMVDWLFSIISADADAVAAINDLVQVCLLLAAHAPVKRILAARIKQPVVPVPNAPFTLHVDPRVVRVGMQVLVHAPATNLPIARGVIEDVLVDGAAARVSDVLTPGVTLDESMRVTLQSGPALSSGQAQARESKSAASSSRSPDDARQMAQAGLQLKQRLR